MKKESTISRFLSVLLTFVLVASMFPVSALAAGRESLTSQSQEPIPLTAVTNTPGANASDADGNTQAANADSPSDAAGQASSDASAATDGSATASSPSVPVFTLEVSGDVAEPAQPGQDEGEENEATDATDSEAAPALELEPEPTPEPEVADLTTGKLIDMPALADLDVRALGLADRLDAPGLNTLADGDEATGGNVLSSRQATFAQRFEAIQQEVQDAADKARSDALLGKLESDPEAVQDAAVQEEEATAADPDDPDDPTIEADPDLKRERIADQNSRTERAAAAALAALAATATPQAATLGTQEEASGNAEGDGNKIENIGVHWVTQDTLGTEDPEHPNHNQLSLRPGDDTKQSMQFQVEFSLSGQYDYEPGAVELVIPAQIWRNHAGNPVGTMTLSVPEDPQGGANFAWRLVDGNYIITNTRTLPAASKAMFQFTIRDIVPHEVSGGNGDGNASTFGERTDLIQPIVNVVTHAGNTLTKQVKEEDALYARMDTQQEISYSTKSGSMYENYTSVPSSLLENLPAGANPGDYVYVQWGTYANHAGNQPFTLQLYDELPWDENIVNPDGSTGDYQYHGILLGSTSMAGGGVRTGYQLDADGLPTPAESNRAVYAEEDVYTGYHTSIGPDHYRSIWSAYPKNVEIPNPDAATDPTAPATITVSQFPPAGQRIEGNDVHDFTPAGYPYYFNNTAHWDLVSSDDGRLTEKDPPAQLRYAPTTFIKPRGDFGVHKYTEYKPRHDYDYGYALNRLLAGRDTTMNFQVETVGYGMEFTLRDGGDPLNPDDYGYKSYTMVTTDNHTYFNYDYANQLTGDDYEITSVRIGEPTMYGYGKRGDGRYSFSSDGSIAKPDVELWLRTQADAGKATPDAQNPAYYETLPASYVLEGATDEHGTVLTSNAAQANAEAGFVHYATISWATGKPVITYTGALGKTQGATQDGTNVAMPYCGATLDDGLPEPAKRIVDYRTVVNTKAPGISYSTYPTMALHPTDRVRQVVQELFDQYGDNPSTKFRNDVQADFYVNDGQKYEVRDYENSLATLSGASLGVTSQKTVSYDPVADNDVANRSITLHYTARVKEQTNIRNLSDYLEAASPAGEGNQGGSNWAETSGTWYDLLPEGVAPVLDSVKLRTDDRVTGVQAIPNYNNTNRTLMVVTADLTPVPTLNTEGYYDEPLLTFDATYTYDDMAVYGDKLKNLVAFESGNDQDLGTKSGRQGEYDSSPGARPDGSTDDRNYQTSGVFADDAERQLMSGLGGLSDTDKARFVFASVPVTVSADHHAVASLKKYVKADWQTTWSDGLGGKMISGADEETGEPTYTYEEPADGVYTYEGHGYAYRVTASVLSGKSIQDIVFYDHLEVYRPSEASGSQFPDDWESGTWQGTFRSVDVGPLEALGVKPVVYYALKDASAFGGVQNIDDGFTFGETTEEMTDTGAYNVTHSGGFIMPWEADGSHANYWVPAAEYEQAVAAGTATLTNVKAVAIDCRYMADTTGQEADGILRDRTNEALRADDYRVPFVLEKDDTTVAMYEIHMDTPQNGYHYTGPDGDEGERSLYADGAAALDPHNNAHAFNDNYLRCTAAAEGDSTSTNQAIWNHYTKVGILPFSIKFDKIWQDGDNRDGKRDESVTVGLFIGDPANGVRAREYDPTRVVDVVTVPNQNAEEGEEWHGDFGFLPYKYLVDTKDPVTGELHKANEPIDYQLAELEVGADGNPIEENGKLKVKQNTPESPYRMVVVPVSVWSDDYQILNIHAPEKVPLAGQKVWDDGGNVNDTRPESIKVTLWQQVETAAGSNAFGPKTAVETKVVSVDASGNWSYDFGQRFAYAPVGRKINYSISEEYVPGYVRDYADANGRGDAVSQVTNEYSPFGDLMVGKTLVNATPTAAQTEFTFELLLNRVEDEEAADGSTETLPDGTILGQPVAGEYAYKVFDDNGTPGNTSDDSQAFYYDGYGARVPVEGTIQTGGSLTLKGGQYAVVYRVPSETYYRWVEEDAAGFRNTAAEGTSGLLEAGHQVKDDLSNLDDAAQASFENTYDAAGAVQLNALKTLSGRNIMRAQFRFQLSTNLEDLPNSVVRSASNSLLGTVSFSQLRYTLDDLRDGDGELQASKDFTYYLSEVNRGLAGYTYDDSIVRVVVRVSDNGDGTLSASPAFYNWEWNEEYGPDTDNAETSKVGDEEQGAWVESELPLPLFKNEYHAEGQVVLRAWKDLKNRVLQDGEFTFELLRLDEEGNQESLGTVQNAADGSVVFSPADEQFAEVLSFDQDDVGNTYYFAIRELEGLDSTVNYSVDSFGYAVTVYDNGDGTLSFRQNLAEPIWETVNAQSDFQVGGWWIAGKLLTKAYSEEQAKLAVRNYSISFFTSEGRYSKFSDETAQLFVDFLFENGVWEYNGPTSYGLTYYSGTLGSGYPTLHDVLMTDDAYSQNGWEWLNSMTLQQAYDADRKPVLRARYEEGGGAVGFFMMKLRGGSEKLIGFNDTGEMPVFANTLKPGSLTLEKFIEGDGADPAQEFEFRIKLQTPPGEDLPEDFGGYTVSKTLNKAMFGYVTKEGDTYTPIRTATGGAYIGTRYANEGDTFPSISQSPSDFPPEDGYETPASWTWQLYNQETGTLSPYSLDTPSTEDIVLAQVVNKKPTTSTPIDDEDSFNTEPKDVDTSLQMHATDAQLTGSPYAVLDPDGTLTFIRSTDTGIVNGEEGQSIEDITGHVWSDAKVFLASEGYGSTAWGTSKSLVKKVVITPEQPYRPISCSSLFADFANATTFDLSGLDTSRTTSFDSMFSGCGSVERLDLRSFDTSSVSTFNFMFRNCVSLQAVDVSSFDTSAARQFWSMFSGCSSLEALDLGNFNTSNVPGGMGVNGAGFMLHNCSGLQKVNLSSFDLLPSETRAERVRMTSFFAGTKSLVKLAIGSRFSLWSANYDGYPRHQETEDHLSTWTLEGGDGSAYDAADLATLIYNDPSATKGVWIATPRITTYTVTYNANGGAGAMPNSEFTASEVANLPTPSFVRYGYHFAGWGLNADGAGNASIFTDDTATSIKANQVEAGGSLQLYAQWEPDDNTLAFQDGEATVKLRAGEQLQLDGIPAGTTYQIWENTPKGWTLVQQSGTGGVIAPNEISEASFTNEYTPSTTAVNLYATKTLDGQPADAAGQFQFQLANDARPGTVLQTKPNLAGGFVTFDTIRYREDGLEADVAAGLCDFEQQGEGDAATRTWTYTYVIREVVGTSEEISYDQHDAHATVTVTMNADGDLSSSVSYEGGAAAFANTTRPGELTLTKHTVVPGFLTGGDPNRQFAFTVRFANSLGQSLDNVSYSVQEASAASDGGDSSSPSAPRNDAGGMTSQNATEAVAAREDTETVAPQNGKETVATQGDAEVETATPPDDTEAEVAPSQDETDGTVARDEAEPATEARVALRGALEDTLLTMTSEPVEDAESAKDSEDASTLPDAEAPSTLASPVARFMSRMNVPVILAQATGDPIVDWTIYEGNYSGGSTGSSLEWMIDSDGVLHIRSVGDSDVAVLKGTNLAYSSRVPWIGHMSEITKVEVDSGTFKLEGTAPYHLFYQCNNLTSVDCSRFDTSEATNFAYMFGICEKLVSLDLSKFDTSQAEDMSFMLLACRALEQVNLSSFDTSNVKNFQQMFGDCEKLETIDLSAFDTSKATNLNWMFGGCSGLKSIDLSRFTTIAGASVSGLLRGCGSLTSVDLSKMDFTNVKSMEGFLGYCPSLESVSLSEVNLSSATSLRSAFMKCEKLKSIDFSGADLGNVTSMASMFEECSKLESAVFTNTKMSKVASMERMFYNCGALKSIDCKRQNHRVVGKLLEYSK